MSGLLEKLLAKLETVDTKLDALLANDSMGAAATSPVQTVDEAAAEAVKQEAASSVAEKVESQDVPVAPVTTDTELDVNGVPFNDTLHSGSSKDPAEKRQNQAGQWKMRRGADKDAYKQWRLDHMNGGTAPSAPTPPPPPSAPVPPSAVSATAATPPPPPAPVNAGATPPPAAPESTAKTKILSEIKEITETYGVPHEFIDKYAFGKYGVDTLDAVPVASHEELATFLKGWGDYLEMCQAIIDQCDEMDNAGIPQVAGIVDGCNHYIREFGSAGPLGAVPKEALPQLHDALTKQHKQWADYVKSVQG